jgi:hypothetical protein
MDRIKKSESSSEKSDKKVKVDAGEKVKKLTDLEEAKSSSSDDDKFHVIAKKSKNTEVKEYVEGMPGGYERFDYEAIFKRKEEA